MKIYIKPTTLVTNIYVGHLLLPNSGLVQQVEGENNGGLQPGEGTDDSGRSREYSIWDDEGYNEF